MNDVLVYINNELIDLDDAVVPVSLKLFEIGDIRTRFANFTPQIKVKKSEQNEKVFGFASDVNSNTDKPYIKLPAKIIQRGVEIMPGCLAVISAVDEMYKIEFFSGAFGFFETIKGKTISEIDFGEGLITWNAAKIATVRTFSSALISPVVQYGQIDETGVVTNIGSPYLPSVRYKSIIEKLIEQAGYTPDGAVFSEEKYLNMVVAYSRDKFDFGKQFKNNREFIGKKNVVQAVTGANQVITYDETLLQDAYGFFDAATGRYDFPFPFPTDDRVFKVSFYAEITFQVLSGTYNFKLNSSDINLPNTETENFTAGTYTTRIGVDYGLDDLPGWGPIANPEWFEIRCDVQVAGACNILKAKFYNKVYGENDLTTNPQFLVEEILPDLDQGEMMKDFAMRFGLIFSEKDNILKCRMIKEIIQDKTNALNWTSKRDLKVQASNFFSYKNYAQSNKFTYPSNDALFIEGINDGVLSILNANIEEEKEFYESIFNGTFTGYIYNTAPASIYCAKIPVWDAAPSDYFTEFSSSPGLRILLLRDPKAGEPNVIYNAIGRSDYKVGYFVDTLIDSLSWQSFLDSYYLEIAAALIRAKGVKLNYTLNEIDINQLNQEPRLIFDEDAYYLINTIDKYIGDTDSTKTEILKIS